MTWLGPPIDVRSLFAPQQAAFIALLRRLDTGEWAQPTVCPGWTVQDVAAHELGDHLGRLSRHRDGFQPLHRRDGEASARFLDRINHEWVIAARRISPRLLIELLGMVGDQIVDFWRTVDINQLGGAVSWAGPGPAPVWLDAARDFTEYWTHQQQIAEATGHPGLTQPDYLGPVLDTFLRGRRRRGDAGVHCDRAGRRNLDLHPHWDSVGAGPRPTDPPRRAGGAGRRYHLAAVHSWHYPRAGRQQSPHPRRPPTHHCGTEHRIDHPLAHRPRDAASGKLRHRHSRPTPTTSRTPGWRPACGWPPVRGGTKGVS